MRPITTFVRHNSIKAILAAEKGLKAVSNGKIGKNLFDIEPKFIGTDVRIIKETDDSTFIAKCDTNGRIVNKPFKSGDFVELENINGRVHEIKLMYTVFTTADNKRVIVPNSHITSNNIINYNAEGRRRLDMTFSVSYSDDIALAKQVLRAQALKNELVYKNPEPEVVVKQQSASSIDLLLMAWCSSSDYLTAYYKLQEDVKTAFDENGINIPFNQLDVHVSNS